MRTKLHCLLLVPLGWALPVFSQADFRFLLSGPEAVDAAPGADAVFTIAAQIAQSEITRPEDGIEAWSMSLAIEGCSVAALTTVGTASEGAEFLQPVIVAGGVTLAVILDYGAPPRTLPIGARTHTVLRLDLVARIPAGGACTECNLRFVSGLQGAGQPVANIVTARQLTYRPYLGAKRILVRPDPWSQRPRVDLTAAAPRYVWDPAELVACNPVAGYSFTAPPGKPLVLTLTGDADSSAVNELYIRWGAVPTPSEFDHAAREVSPNQKVAISAAEAETCYVMARSTRFPAGGTAHAALSVESVELALVRMSPSAGAQGYRTSAVIQGTGFSSGAVEFRLRPAQGSQIQPAGITVISPERAEVAFDIPAEASLGKYALDVTRTETGLTLTAALPDAFEVFPPAFKHGLAVELIGRSFYGFSMISRVTLRYRNVSTQEMTAPLFRVIPPPDTDVKLERDAGWHTGEMLVLGINALGFAGRLAPGAGHDIPIIFRSRQCPDAPACTGVFRVEVLSQDNPMTIPWDTLPAPAGGRDWETVRPALARSLGSTWTEYQAHLADIGTTLTRRGVDAASVVTLFRQAYRTALKLPAAAAVGRVTGPLADLSRLVIQAQREGTSAACAVTDARGTFAIEGLVNGESYELVYGDATARIDVPGDNDRLNCVLQIAARNAKEPTCEVSSEPGVPTEALMPPDEHFAPLLSWSTWILGSWDPNDKGGPNGDPILGYVSDEALTYWISFENLGAAPAQRVQIVDRLGEGLDPFTVRLREVVLWNEKALSADFFGAIRESGYNWAEANYQAHAYERVRFPSPVDAARDLFVDIDVVVDAAQRTITWTFQTLDPTRLDSQTGRPLPPDDVLEGFLPPAGSGGRNRGVVVFTIRTESNLSEDADCRNDATIKFDSRKEIATRTWWNPYTAYPTPETPDNPSPPDGSIVPAGTCLGWQASQYNSVRYDLYLRKEGEAEPAVPTVADLRENGRCPHLDPDTAYRWRVVAKNAREDPGEGDMAAGPRWRFRTQALSVLPEFRRGRVNPDATVNIADAVFLLSYLFARGTPPSCEDAADTNDDGKLNIADAVKLLSHLFAKAGPLPAPFEACGSDPTTAPPDTLGCEDFPECNT